MKYALYYLICPLTNEVKWVGITKNVKERYWQHTRKNTKHKEKDLWMDGLRKMDLKPILKIVENELSSIEAEEMERGHIAKFKTLFNSQPGGFIVPTRLGSKQTAETRRKRSISDPRRKKVLQFDKKGNLIQVHEGVREACRNTGIDHRSIAQVAGGSLVRKSAGNFIWKYN